MSHSSPVRATVAHDRRGPAFPTRLLRPLLAALVLAVCAGPARAQLSFTELALTDTSFDTQPGTDFWIASAAPADVDGDGDLDLLVAGYYVDYILGFVEDRLTLYRNDGAAGPSTWALTPVPVDATGLYFSAGDIAWGDYDNDGDPDVAVAGRFSTTLYRNDAGTLVRTSTALPQYEEYSSFSTLDLYALSWVDFDNDGDLDLFVPCVIDPLFQREPPALLRNDGPGTGSAWTFTPTAQSLPQAANSLGRWADMDADGDMDLLFANVSDAGDNFLETWRNDAGTLARRDTGLAYIRYGMADWADADNDGDLDIVYAGNMDVGETGETAVRVLFDDGPAGWRPVDVILPFQSPEEPWLDFNAVTWADYDSDGDVDLLVSGLWVTGGEIVGRSEVYANSGGTFALAGAPLPAPIAGNTGGAFAWFDVDSDGDLDYFVAGAYYVPNGGGLVESRAQLFRTDAPSTNQAPAILAGLSATPAGPGAIHLAWLPGADDHTPSDAITYELEVAPQGGAFARLVDTPARRLPEPGNVSGNTGWTLRHLDAGAYQWRVRAVDNAFNGGPLAVGSFSIGAAGVPPGTFAGVSLSAPTPNPARGASVVRLSLDRERDVRLAVHDVLGRLVTRVHEGPLPPGPHAFRLDARRLPAGVYNLRLESEGFERTQRWTVIR